MQADQCRPACLLMECRCNLLGIPPAAAGDCRPACSARLRNTSRRLRRVHSPDTRCADTHPSSTLSHTLARVKLPSPLYRQQNIETPSQTPGRHSPVVQSLSSSSQAV
eukprot:694205-Rhodomonas_salina.4